MWKKIIYGIQKCNPTHSGYIWKISTATSQQWVTVVSFSSLIIQVWLKFELLLFCAVYFSIQTDSGYCAKDRSSPETPLCCSGLLPSSMRYFLILKLLFNRYFLLFIICPGGKWLYFISPFDISWLFVLIQENFIILYLLLIIVFPLHTIWMHRLNIYIYIVYVCTVGSMEIFRFKIHFRWNFLFNFWRYGIFGLNIDEIISLPCTVFLTYLCQF